MTTQELQIVEVFSAASVPEEIIRGSNIKELVKGMLADQQAVRDNESALDRRRKEQSEGNFVGNWWNDRGDKVQDAQMDLSKAIGRLTEKSSQLLIVNTAISKVLSDQQRTLQGQQVALKEQADTLANQNGKILDQQRQLGEQQGEINKANRGLMEAKGLTQEQAQQLVGCVVRVTAAEQKMESANQELRETVKAQLDGSVAQCLERLDVGFAENRAFQSDCLLRVDEATAAGLGQVQQALERLLSTNAEFKREAGQHQQAQAAAIEQHRLAQETAAGQLREQTALHMKRVEQGIPAAVDQAMALHLKDVDRRLSELRDAAAVKDVELKGQAAALAALRSDMQAQARTGRAALAGIACVSLLSIGWQLVRHFAPA